MRRIAALALALLAAAALVVWGQEPQAQQEARQGKEVRLSERARRRIERRLKRLDEVLNLTEVQKRKIRAILERQAAQFSRFDRQRLRSLPPRERRRVFQRLHAAREKTRAEIEKVLTEEQRRKYRKFLEEEWRRRGRRFGPPRG